MFKSFLFILSVSLFLDSNAQSKVSPVTQLYLNLESGELRNAMFPPAQDLRALVYVDNKPETYSALNNLGVKVNSKCGKVWSIQATPDLFNRLIELPGILYVDMSSRANSSVIKNDTTAILSKVDKVWAGASNGLSSNFTGKNVIVGIVDVGFQSDHPTFYSADGSVNRIKRFWNQVNNNGPAPAGFNYGKECKTELDMVLELDNDGFHGTHVAGIAAGSGHTTPGNKFRGMAPESDLVFVNIKYSNSQYAGSAIGDYLVANPTIIDGFTYIFDYAKSQGKPAVINLSWGMHTGPHDGTSLFDIAVDNLTGKGLLLAGANGNDGQGKLHLNKKLVNDTAYTFALDNRRSDEKKETVYCDFWGSENTSFSLNVSILDTSGNVVGTGPWLSSNTDQYTTQNLVFGTDTLKAIFMCQKKYINNSKPNILLIVENYNQLKNRIRIGMTGTTELHAWNSGAAYRWTNGAFRNSVKGNDYTGLYIDGDNQNSMGENGGTGKSTISSGAYIARNKLQQFNGKWGIDNSATIGAIANFSSYGNTIDGRVKPDITSPGQNIISAYHKRSYPGWAVATTSLKTVFKADTNYWGWASGTSMASPHTCGVLALMLQANPFLTPAQAKDILKLTAAKDGLTGNSLPDNHWGYGKIDAFEAVKQSSRLASINGLNTEVAGVYAFPNPATNEVKLRFSEHNKGMFVIVVSDVQGRVIKSWTENIGSGNNHVVFSTDHLQSGFYFITATQNEFRNIIKLVIDK